MIGNLRFAMKELYQKVTVAELERFRRDEVGPAEPFVVGPGIRFADRIREQDEAAFGRGHGDETERGDGNGSGEKGSETEPRETG